MIRVNSLECSAVKVRFVCKFVLKKKNKLELVLYLVNKDKKPVVTIHFTVYELGFLIRKLTSRYIKMMEFKENNNA